ncbi:hypothetical protein AB0M80_35975 [Amycolatopsis sp. NPDC051045]|uniref:hypothetical protein n=1 Tax=Amycolatopsis sp. NPDC051045 TaxID=3156922 RepID=UPI003415EDCC
MATGALISGRRTFELAGRWGGDHHDGVPIHVLTHRTAPHPARSCRIGTCCTCGTPSAADPS